MKKINLKIALALIIGIGLGIFIADVKTISVRELKTVSSSSFVRSNESVTFASNLGLASFDGAWISVAGEKMVNDINSVYIYCWKDRQICEIAQANIYDGDFFNGINYYDITEWSESGQITANASSLCEDQTLKADIKTKVVTLTESKQDGADKEVCVQTNIPTVLRLGSRGYGEF